MNTWLFISAISGFMAVVAGVFSAHGAEGILGAENAERIATAARYQMYHALALFGLVLLAGQQRSLIDGLTGTSPDEWPGLLTAAAVSFALGTVLFSICLYVYAATDLKFLARVLPFGGISFMFGWALLAWYALRGVQD